MKVTVLFFATLRSLSGVKSTVVELPYESRVSDLKMLIGEHFPQVATALAGTTLVAVNREYADDDQVLLNGDEVALFPPVSGG
jgi:molybdopterin synthase catalytic subunit